MGPRKLLWWSVFFAGAGGVAAFLYICAIERPPRLTPPQCLWYLWPLLTLLMAVVSAVQLFRCYREEPVQAPGLWQLRLADLLAVSFGMGLLFAIFRALWPERFVQVGVPASLLLGLIFVLGLLNAVRRGITGWVLKYLFAAGYVMCLYGALGIGAFVVLLFIATFILGEPHKATDLRGTGVMYFGVVCLPAGLALCAICCRRRDRK